MKLRVIFVDDEPNLLMSLKRVLRPLRHEWEMVFTESALKALELMEIESFDVVVTDMRMPGMNGIQLLTNVMKLYPKTVRIILSGQADQEDIMKSVSVSHQFLTKPCEVGEIKSTILRACALFDLLKDESVKKIVSRVKCLPSLPTLYAEITEELKSTTSSIRNVGEIISKDAGMTAQVLKLVNSSFFGLRQEVKTPSNAISYLGIDTVKSLVLMHQLFSQFKIKIPGFSLEALWEHNKNTGVLARAIAEAEGQEKNVINTSFMAGLLHDVGKLVFADNFSEQFSKAVNLNKKENIPLWEAEAEIIGVTHGEIGAYLIGLWGLPAPLVEALAFHHDPCRSMCDDFSPLTAVHMANIFEHGEIETDTELKFQFDDNYMANLKMTDRLHALTRICQDVMQEGNKDG